MGDVWKRGTAGLRPLGERKKPEMGRECCLGAAFLVRKNQLGKEISSPRGKN